MKKLLFTALIFFALSLNYSSVNAQDIEEASFIPFQQIKNIVVDNRFINKDIKQAQSTTKSLQNFTIAHERFSQSNIISAYNEYEKLTRNADNDFSRIMLAYELSEKGFFTLAQDNFNNITDKDMWNTTIDFMKKMYFPKNMPTKEDELKLAEYYTDIYYNNLSFEAAKSLSKDNELLKKTDYAYFILSKAYFESKETYKAQNSINKAIALNKTNLNYKKYRAQILSEDKKYDESLKVINEIISQSSPSVISLEQNITLRYYIYAQAKKDSAQSKYYLANYLFRINDTQRAIKEANISIFMKKKNADAYNLLGNIYYYDNNMHKALENYNRAAKIKKDTPQTLLGLANIEFYRDDYDKALELYLNVLKKQKNNEDALLNVSVCYAMKKDFKAARLWLEKLLAQYPYNYKGYYLFALIDFSNSEKLLKKAIAINPLYLDAWSNLAKTEIEKGNIALAKTYLMPLDYLSYKNFMYYYCKGLIYQNNGELEKALKAFEQAVTLYGEFEPARKAMLKAEENLSKKDINDKI